MFLDSKVLDSRRGQIDHYTTRRGIFERSHMVQSLRRRRAHRSARPNPHWSPLKWPRVWWAAEATNSARPRNGRLAS